MPCLQASNLISQLDTRRCFNLNNGSEVRFIEGRVPLSSTEPLRRTGPRYQRADRQHPPELAQDIADGHVRDQAIADPDGRARFSFRPVLPYDSIDRFTFAAVRYHDHLHADNGPVYCYDRIDAAHLTVRYFRHSENFYVQVSPSLICII